MGSRQVLALARVAKKFGWKPRFCGVVDEISPSRVKGWAIDRRRPDLPARIAVLLDGEIVAFGEAGAPRPDVAAHGYEFGHCGYEIALDLLPKELLQGAVTVAVCIGDRPVHSLGADGLMPSPAFRRAPAETKPAR